MLSYNHPEHTRRAVSSVLAQGLSAVYIVHNGSLPKHEQGLRELFPNLTHVTLQVNRGYSGGANAGLRAALEDHEWALLLTNDSLLQCAPVLPPQPGIVAPLIYRRKTGIVDSAGGAIFPDKGLLVHLRSKDEFEKQRGKGAKLYVPGTCFLVHRDVVARAGYLDESLVMFWDDVEWSLRVQRHGFPVLVDDRWTVMHKVGKTTQKQPWYSLYLFQRNRRIVSFRFSTIYEWPLLAFRLAVSWSRLATALVRKGRTRDLPLLLAAILGFTPRKEGESEPGKRQN